MRPIAWGCGGNPGPFRVRRSASNPFDTASGSCSPGRFAADLVLLPPVAERDAAGVAELRYGVGCAAAEPGERLDGLLSLLCAVHSHVLLVLFWSRISTAAPSAQIFLTKHTDDRGNDFLADGRDASHMKADVASVQVATLAGQPCETITVDRGKEFADTTRSPRCTMRSTAGPASASGSGRPWRSTAQKCCTCFENSSSFNA